MSFDKSGYPTTDEPVPVGTTVPVEKPCLECGGQLAAKHVVRKRQDCVWPSGPASGSGKVNHILVEFCPKCDPEPTDEIEVDPSGLQKRMIGQD